MGKCIVVKLRQAGHERVLDFVATEDAKLDVGTISGSFGLNPSSVKFNDVYVSRSPDFISSVTWGNLLGYFVKKGYSTGKSEQDPILVDGKPCDTNGAWIQINHPEDLNLCKPEDIGPGGKRRIWFEDSMIVNVLKKKKIIQENFDVNSWEIHNHYKQFQEEGNSNCNKRGHPEDAGEMNVVKKHTRFQCDSVLPELLDVNSGEIHNHSQQFREEGNSYCHKRDHPEDDGEMDIVKKRARFQCDSDLLDVNSGEIHNHSQQFREEGNSYCNKRGHPEDDGEMDIVKKHARFQCDSVLPDLLDVNFGKIHNHSQQFREDGNSYCNKMGHPEDAGGMDIVKKHARSQCESGVDFKSHLQQNKYIVQNGGDFLNLNCNMELKKRTISDEMLAFSPCKRAR